MSYSEKCLAEGFFARHETFCPRYGWLKKGFDEVSKDPNVFDGPDDIERLGVGKNMVRSIRFWCVAFRLIKPDIESGPRRLGGPMRATPFGKALLADDGWNPCLEDPASLWLLHWQLFSAPISATAWSLAINLGHVGSFTLKEMDHALKERKNSYPVLARYSDSSIEKDASCFIRMYAPPDSQRISEEIECPFTDLGLLAPSDEKQAFRFNMSDKTTLPEEIFLAACCDYALKTQSSKALSLNKVSYDFNAPGVVFKLSESDVGYRIEEASQKFGEDVRFVELYGSRQIQFERDPRDLYWRVFDRHYHLTGKGLEILSRLVAALNGERVCAWSLTGPYGMGKSSFANFLMALCGPEADEEAKTARRMLLEKDKYLARELYHVLGKRFARTNGLFRVAVTSSFESINRTLANGLRRALVDLARAPVVKS